MVAQNFEAFDQWKNIFNVVTHIKSIDFFFQNPAHAGFFGDVVRTIFSMLKQFPQDFFYDILSKDSFVSEALISLFETLTEFVNFDVKSVEVKRVQERTRKRAISLKKMLNDMFGFDVERATQSFDEDEEFRPVVVENPHEFYKF